MKNSIRLLVSGTNTSFQYGQIDRFVKLVYKERLYTKTTLSFTCRCDKRVCQVTPSAQSSLCASGILAWSDWPGLISFSINHLSKMTKLGTSSFMGICVVNQKTQASAQLRSEFLFQGVSVDCRTPGKQVT